MDYPLTDKEIPTSSEKYIPGPSDVKNTIEKDTHKPFDPIKMIQKEKEQKSNKTDIAMDVESSAMDVEGTTVITETGDEKTKKMLTHGDSPTLSIQPQKQALSQENLERRLRIEEEVTFVSYIMLL